MTFSGRVWTVLFKISLAQPLPAEVANFSGRGLPFKSRQISS